MKKSKHAHDHADESDPPTVHDGEEAGEHVGKRADSPDDDSMLGDYRGGDDGGEDVGSEEVDGEVIEGEEGALHRQFKVKTNSRPRPRIDRYVQGRLKGISRSRVQKLIDFGGITVNGKIPKASTSLCQGDVIDVILPPQASSTIDPEPIPLHVLYEDDWMIVLNKQKNLIIHPARGNKTGTLLNAMAYHLQKNLDGLSKVGKNDDRPGVVHRLDKNTTGCIVMAKQDEAHWAIARQFEQRTCLKVYMALVHGNFDESAGVIDEPIGKHPTIREAFAVRHDHTSKDSVTLFRVREQYEGYSLVELELKTGRTHQIRVHLTFMGHPIVGDITYGGQPIGPPELIDPPIAAGSRAFMPFARTREEGLKAEAVAAAREDNPIATPALHAALLRITHPIDHHEMTFTAPFHDDLLSLMRELRTRPHDGPVCKDGFWIDLNKAVPD